MSKYPEIYEPKGLRFYDAQRGEMLLIEDPSRDDYGWLCYRHPDGQWVTLRKATDDDLRRINRLADEIRHVRAKVEALEGKLAAAGTEEGISNVFDQAFAQGKAAGDAEAAFLRDVFDAAWQLWGFISNVAVDVDREHADEWRRVAARLGRSLNRYTADPDSP